MHIAPADYRYASHLRLLRGEINREIADRIMRTKAGECDHATVAAPSF